MTINNSYLCNGLTNWGGLPSTLVGNSNDPPQKYCILDVIKRLINQSRLVKTGRNWSKLVETGWNWSKLSKLVETCNGLPCSKTNRTFIWTFLNLIFLLSDTSNHGWHSMFYESLIILNISTLNFSEGVPASVLCGTMMSWVGRWVELVVY